MIFNNKIDLFTFNVFHIQSAMLKENLVKYLEDSLRDNWNKLSLSDYKGCEHSYKEVAEQISRIQLTLELSGIQKGDKIALIGKNSTNWGIIFVSIVAYGAVAVPILPDFLPDDVQHIVNHSDSKLLFSSDSLFDTLDVSQMKNLLAVFSVNDFSLKISLSDSLTETFGMLDTKFAERFSGTFTKESLVFPHIPNSELAMISYTSGTTGNSKGVMLSHNSLAANIRFAQNNMPLKSGDKIVSFLPLAHSYGLAFEFLFPFTLGCHITFLTKTPSPQIITQAFSEIKPRLILSVPLVIEKIYKKQLLPTISKAPMKFLLKVPGINKILFNKINNKLTDVFGGNFHEVIIGGAPFSADAEKFFNKIGFHYTVGYGMTECGPLISYSSWDITKIQASGRAVDTLEVRIDSNDQENEVGEILIKGENVMNGYYKNEEATKQAIDKDGWLHSGDLGVIDSEGNIFIKGRSKSMLLGPSGQNIYPEEIESKINNQQCVGESVVIQKDGKLIAKVFPDLEYMQQNKISESDLESILDSNRKELNQKVPAYMSVSKYEIHNEEFVKTPKRNIKRYLYT
jgi:long-chain acyl-CoA synthetase